MDIRESLSFKVLYTESSFPVSEIVKLAKTRYKNKTGVVYCLKEVDCQTLLRQLIDCGVRGLHYNTAMTDDQKSWMELDDDQGVIF